MEPLVEAARAHGSIETMGRHMFFNVIEPTTHGTSLQGSGSAREICVGPLRGQTRQKPLLLPQYAGRRSLTSLTVSLATPHDKRLISDE